MVSTRNAFVRIPVSLLTLVIGLVVTLAACGSAPASQPTDQPTAQPTESAADVSTEDQDQENDADTDAHATTTDTESSHAMEMETDEDTDADGHASMDLDTDTDDHASMDQDMNTNEDMDTMDDGSGMDTGHGHGGSNSAAYMVITNDSDTPDAIIKADTNVAETVELHTVINENGVMKMRPVEQIDIPAQGSQQLKPGGFHVMLLGITQDLNTGDTVDLTLTLEQAGDIQITAPISMMPLEEDDQTITSGAITIQSPWVRAAVALPAEEDSMEHSDGTMDMDQEHTDEHEGEHADEHESVDLSAIVPIAAGETLQVVATTSIVGDVVQNIGGDAIDLKVLMPVGTDPHTFEPTPQDIAAMSEADVVFVNGVGLETFLEPLLEGAEVDPGRIISVSQSVPLLAFAGKPDDEVMTEHEHADEHETSEMTDHGDEHHHSHGDMDPHVWFNPLNVEAWAHTIEQTLTHANPTDAATYTDNAQQYIEELHSLDTWIQEQVALIPEANRQMVTDHTAFGYFAAQYGVEQIGAVIPGFSTLAEPTAQDLAALEDLIREQGVPALFVGTTVNPALAERVAQDTGIKIARLYTGSLSESGGEATNYLDFMRYNTTAIVEALQNTVE